MYEKLFAEGGLSLDRLRALVEVAASGGIAKAAPDDPVRQSQYSRQIRELEDFFRVKLLERVGKGVQLTGHGKELARISRFFLRGLSNFQRGSLADQQTFRIGASSTMIQKFLADAVVEPELNRHRFILQTASDDEIERRLHDLSLDFGIVRRRELSRPLHLGEFGRTKLALVIPKRLASTKQKAAKLVKEGRSPLATASNEAGTEMIQEHLCGREPHWNCESFLSALQICRSGIAAAVLPMFLAANLGTEFWRIDFPKNRASLRFALAWNPRLLRLNPHVVRTRDSLLAALKERFRSA